MIRAVDTSEIQSLINANSIAEDFDDDLEGVLIDIFTDLTSSPPDGTPVKTGAARNSWQFDLPNREVYSTSPYMAALNAGHSRQSPAGFVDAIIDKHTR